MFLNLYKNSFFPIILYSFIGKTGFLYKYQEIYVQTMYLV